MTPDELRQAAERVRRVNALVPLTDPQLQSWDTRVAEIYGVNRSIDPDDLMTLIENDRYELSEAYLASHPEDDGEPVTEALLSRHNFMIYIPDSPDQEPSWQLIGESGEVLLELCRYNDVWQEVHIGWPHDIHVWKQVRLLIEAVTC